MHDFQKAKTLKGELTANQMGFFIMSEIELGLSFVDVAVTTTNDKTKQCNRDNARRVHDCALTFLRQDTSLTHAQRGEVEASLANLQGKIDRLH